MININSSTPIIGIYKITSPSGKVYIGQSTNIHKRWLKYKQTNCHKQYKIYRSLIKYGPENHVFEIIEECSVDNLKECEIYWKQYYINMLGWEKTLFHFLYDTNGVNRSRPVNQYDLKGNFIQEWPSVMEAKKIHKGDISSCCKGRQKKANNYVWKYKDEGEFILTSLSRKGKNIIQFDKQMNIIKEWESIKEAATELGIQRGDISMVVKGRNKTAGGFIWKYKNL